MDQRGQIVTQKSFLILAITIILIALIFGNGELSNKFIVLLIMLFLVNPALSFFINKWIDSLGLEWLDDINIVYELGGYELSITAYTILSGALFLILF